MFLFFSRILSLINSHKIKERKKKGGTLKKRRSDDDDDARSLLVLLYSILLKYSLLKDIFN